jgi:hypothetical protein
VTDYWFSDDLRKQIAQIQKAMQTSAVQDALRQIASVQPYLAQIEEVRRSIAPNIEEISRATQQWAEPIRRIQEMASSVSQVGHIQETLESLRPTFEALGASWQAQLPENWRELEISQIKEAVDIMGETGWSLVWTPRAEIVLALIASKPEEHEITLLSHENEILDDLLDATNGLSAQELEHLAEANRQIIRAYRDTPLAAQALAGVAFTTIFHTHLGYKKFKEGRDDLETYDPDEAAIADVRTCCVLSTCLIVIDRYMGEDGEPVPTRFNRHASAHGLSEEQYTRVNALAAAMLITSLLCELDVWLSREEADEV